ncbi:MAG: hypothetical protein V4469_04425 [Patescibacteria group bacterium]
MSETFEHKCIKCSTQYKTDDPDPYYCNDCIIEKNRIAKEIDAKTSQFPKIREKSPLQLYDEARGNGRFPSISSLGIKL